MLKLLKYLKPFIGLIIAAVALLFVQAAADLSLPDYMSDIVNVGIQQGGLKMQYPRLLEKARWTDLPYLSLARKKMKL
jgi:ATP-binding cassette subfamily B protein